MRFTRRWLTDDLLRESYRGHYRGKIAAVTTERVRNQWDGGRHVERLVIRTTDDLLIGPNQPMLEELIARLGRETDNWPGHTITIRRKPVKFKRRKTGEIAVRYVKYVDWDEENHVATEEKPFDEDCDRSTMTEDLTADKIAWDRERMMSVRPRAARRREIDSP